MADGVLSTQSELCDMQILDLRVGGEDTRIDLLPGRYPEWSTDSKYIAFQACLAEENSDWHVDASVSPSVYVGMLVEDLFQVELVSEPICRARNPRRGSRTLVLAENLHSPLAGRW